MKWIFSAIYALILITQFPHIWAAYADIDRDGFQLFSAGAALAFELSTAIFTYRIVRGSRRSATWWGVRFFIALSVVANLAYYKAFGGAVSNVTPYLFSLALPISLALYAQEFGVEIRREERKKGADESQSAQPARSLPQPYVFTCEVCGATFGKQQGLAAHIRHRHKNTNGHNITETTMEGIDESI